jgi:outer membrane biosynthesis protein TonB
LEHVKKLLDDEIALQRQVSPPEAVTKILKSISTPPPVSHAAVLRQMDDDLVKPATPVPKPQTTENQTAKLATPAPRPQPQHQAGYQPEQEKTHIEGAISNRGKNAVSSVATPMAKYRKQVNDAIGSRWYYYIRDKMDLLAFGSVRISFVIDSQGHISRTRVESNSSNSSLAEVSMQAVEEAEIGPPPRDPSGASSEEPLDWTLTFTYYPFSQ